MSRQTLVVPVDWKAIDGDDENVLEGYASTFDNIDLQYDVVAKGAFKSTLSRVRKGEVPYLADHMASVRNVLGTIVDAVEDEKGLKIQVRFAGDADAQAIRQKMEEGHIRKMSIGYEPLQWRYETRGQKRVRVLEDVKLWEVSAVVFPANPEAVIERVKSAVHDTIDEAVQGAVAAGGDEREIKAAIADWAKASTVADVGDVAEQLGAVEPSSSSEGSSSTPHLETGEAEGGDSAESQKGDGPDALTLMYRRADNLLAGRDPDATADPVKYAGTTERLGLLEKWMEQSHREAELTEQLAELRGSR
ncbi:HK97 family phage prohead protease [Streptomyces sp. NPDC007063]|uniref:HK97 family phage prohead protease n=1 Tax=Streptomyces sp. NPDC007063 TaxID=3364772 RepID=UPI0036916660